MQRPQTGAIWKTSEFLNIHKLKGNPILIAFRMDIAEKRRTSLLKDFLKH